jgi:hypothetical protein
MKEMTTDSEHYWLNRTYFRNYSLNNYFPQLIVAIIWLHFKNTIQWVIYFWFSANKMILRINS